MRSGETTVSTKSGSILRSVNPATGETVAEIPAATDTEIERRLDLAAMAARANRSTPLAERTAALERIAETLAARREELARLATEEMGKTLAASRAEIDKCARVCRYYADNAAQFLADETIASDGAESRVVHLPLGVVLAVMPWNFPFWQVFRFLAPALAAGNAALLKHASNVPRVALALEETVHSAGLADGVLQTLLIEPDRVAKVIADPRVAAATVTGSSAAGTSVAAAAGRHAKKTVLELGGSDPFIVMPSADLGTAAAVGVESRTLNNGQSCIGAKRFIVHTDVYDEFVDLFAARLAALTVGDPMQADTEIGPLAMQRARERLNDQVDRLLAAGARRIGGAALLPGPGFYYQPGMLESVPRGTDVYYEELFGPVALLFRADDLDAAIEIANDSRHGLGASIWTHERPEADAAIARLETGATFVNALVRSDPVLPFGGVRGSGYGRELSRDGIREFVNRKSVYFG